MQPLTKLAKRLSYERVPETCPAVHSAGVEAVAKFTHWASSRTRWFARMNRFERHEFEIQIGELVASVLDGAKEHGTLLLRDAYVREIEDRLRTHMTDEQIRAVESGEDPERSLPDSSQLPSGRLYDTPAVAMTSTYHNLFV